jgi:hypothetical protein
MSNGKLPTLKLPLRAKLPLIETLPVNSCLSFDASPNLFEPLA